MFFPAWGCWETCLPGGSQLRGEQFLSFMWEMKRNSCLCCNCREMVLPSGSRGFGLNSQLSFIHFSEPWFFFFLRSIVILILPWLKLSFHYICIKHMWRYVMSVSGGFPLSGRQGWPPNPCPSAPWWGSPVCPALGTWQSLECHSLVQWKAVDTWSLFLALPATVPLFLSDLVQTPCFLFRGPTWKTGSDKNKLQKNNCKLLKVRW